MSKRTNSKLTDGELIKKVHDLAATIYDRGDATAFNVMDYGWAKDALERRDYTVREKVTVQISKGRDQIGKGREHGTETKDQGSSGEIGREGYRG